MSMTPSRLTSASLRELGFDRVLKGAESSSFQQIPEDHVLGESLFFADGLLIYVLCDPSVGMTEQLLAVLMSTHFCRSIVASPCLN